MNDKSFERRIEQIMSETPFERRILHGEFLSDFETQDKDGNFIRIRLILFDNEIYYHHMVNGEVVNLFNLNNRRN